MTASRISQMPQKVLEHMSRDSGRDDQTDSFPSAAGSGIYSWVGVRQGET